MFWWLMCAGSVGAMLGFGLAAMLAAGKRADLEDELRIVADDFKIVNAARGEWKARHDALAYAFSTLCKAMWGSGRRRNDEQEGGREGQAAHQAQAG